MAYKKQQNNKNIENILQKWRILFEYYKNLTFQLFF